MSKIPPNQHIPKELTLLDQVLFEAAYKFGTPLYIYDAALIEQRWKVLRSLLPQNVVIYYSVKANPNTWIIDVFHKLGAHCEVASLGELSAALRAGVSPAKIIFVGPGKSKQELEEAITCDIGAIIAESLREVEDLQTLSQTYKKQARVALRINPGRGKGAIVMGGATQFGIDPQGILDILKNAKDYSSLEVVGLHGYLGTGILDWKVVLEHTQMLLEIADKIQQQSRCQFSFINVGGGFGISYYDRDKTPDWDALCIPLCKLVDDYLCKYPQTKILAIESGRFLVGPSGIFLTSVLDVKKSEDEWFIIVDGGINVFGGYDRYGGFRPTPVRILGYENTKTEPITLCGPLCTTMDRLATDVLLPLPKVGDIVAFYQAGAYGYTASPGLFLSHGFPSEVIVHEGKLSIIRERITPDYFLVGQPRLPKVQ